MIFEKLVSLTVFQSLLFFSVTFDLILGRLIQFEMKLLFCNLPVISLITLSSRANKGSLSNGVFERRTSTGSGLFASLGSGLVETLW